MVSTTVHSSGGVNGVSSNDPGSRPGEIRRIPDIHA